MDDYVVPYSDVTILIPTLNEEKTIGRVIDGFADQGFMNILVIDGKSTDDTQEIAKRHGATVIIQDSNGKGAAVSEALSHIETEYTVMIDGDATYEPNEVNRLLLPLVEDDADEVIGNRFANLKPNSMDKLHQFGNRAINFAFTILTGQYDKDILSGYRAYKTDTLRELGIDEKRFGIETELCTKTALGSYRTEIVPITYHPRPDGSEANLRSFDDGLDIFKTLIKIRFNR